MSKSVGAEVDTMNKRSELCWGQRIGWGWNRALTSPTGQVLRLSLSQLPFTATQRLLPGNALGTKRSTGLFKVSLSERSQI